MSLNSLINDQIKNILNRNTNTVISSISEKLDISKDVLVDIWNKLNTEFRVKNKPKKSIPEILDEDIPTIFNLEIIDEDIPAFKEITIIDEDIIPEIKVEIIDEDF